MTFPKEEIPVMKGSLTAAHLLSGLSNGSQDIQCTYGEQCQIGKSNNKAFVSYFARALSNISSVDAKRVDHLLEKEIINIKKAYLILTIRKHFKI